jgi:hypothetical protein
MYRFNIFLYDIFQLDFWNVLTVWYFFVFSFHFFPETTSPDDSETTSPDDSETTSPDDSLQLQVQMILSWNYKSRWFAT